MTRLDVRLLGGFEVAVDGTVNVLARCESQKVRALLAYLAGHPNHPHGRDGLAQLLWPDLPLDAGRRNLRQALYDLKRALGAARERVAGDRLSVQLILRDGDTVDTLALERAARGTPRAPLPEVAGLRHASDLYRGPFLGGFELPDSDPFEHWVRDQRTRFTELAITTERALAEHHQARGELDRALYHARRLVALNPLSEAAQREFLRLLALTGGRSEAVAHYGDLVRLLDRELGLQPARSTRELYRAIVGERIAAEPGGDEPGPLAPILPLVGRGRALLELGQSLEVALAGGPRVAWVEGEDGVGKTRLIRTFLHRTAGRRRPLVLLGTVSPGGPARCFPPLLELLRTACEGHLVSATEEPEAATPSWLEQIGRHLPPTPPGPRPEGPAEELLVRFLASRLGPTARPVVLFLDDLDRAPVSSRTLLARVLAHFPGQPLWVVASGTRPAGAPAADLAPLPVPVDRLHLLRLGPEAAPELAHGITAGPADGDRLATLLTERGGGLPLQMAALLHLLSDQGRLVQDREGPWRLAGGPDLAGALPAGEVDALVAGRLGLLPPSARRLLAVAAVFGARFEVDRLEQVEGEHPGVVEVAVEALLERGLLRRFPRRWEPGPPVRDLERWALGARRGTFTFAHPRFRQQVYDGLPVERRRVLHRAAAETYAAPAPGGHRWSEELAHHLAAAGDLAAARPHRTAAREHAVRLGDTATGAVYGRR